jgi:hypothetical protein
MVPPLAEKRSELSRECDADIARRARLLDWARVRN